MTRQEKLLEQLEQVLSLWKMKINSAEYTIQYINQIQEHFDQETSSLIQRGEPI